MGATTMTVAAEDTTADALAKLNTAKENLETIKKENAVYGNTITAWDFIVYHATQHNDQNALNYINTNYKNTLDPENDELLEDLQNSIQYISDVNELRKNQNLEQWNVSDLFLLEESHPIQTSVTASPAPTAASSAAATPVPTYLEFAEAIPSQKLDTLSVNLSTKIGTSIGIVSDDINKQYKIKVGTDTTSYTIADYQVELSAFINTTVTAYSNALTAVDTAQKAYDAAVAQKAADDAAKEAAEKAAAQQTAVPLAASSSAVITSAARLQNLPTTSTSNLAKPIPMHRLYNRSSGEHFYTASLNENDWLASLGWVAEGIGWTAPSSSNSPVYRLYNPYSGDHHYTLSATERDSLVPIGWIYEGIGWYSDDLNTVPIYRQFNPNEQVGTHNYTESLKENDWLVTLGWRAEGVGWYGMADTVTAQGIDISEFNGDVDLTQYQNSFVIIRAGWWTNMDQKFLRNVQECERLGIPYGIYLYSYALDTAEAATEANYTLELLKQCHPTVGVWFDMEDADGWKERQNPNFTDGSLISQICQTYCSTVKNAGYHVGIYASYSWFKNYITGCDQYDKWLAFWSYNDGSFTDMHSYGAPLHQFTSTPLDRDVMYVDISHFK
jgi:Lyzozyme M1 (1,4-beta-N-acetylmuramidase)